MKQWLLGFVLLLAGCGSSGSDTSSTTPPDTPFLDQTKSGVLPQQEWNREVVSRQGGSIRYRIEANGKFALTILTDRAFRAIQARDISKVVPSDILQTSDHDGAHEGTIQLPAGSSWFMIMNASGSPMDIKLSCWEAP